MSQFDLIRAFDSYYYEEARLAGARARVDHAAGGEAHPLRYDERGLPIREQLAPRLERMRRRLGSHHAASPDDWSRERHPAPSR